MASGSHLASPFFMGPVAFVYCWLNWTRDAIGFGKGKDILFNQHGLGKPDCRQSRLLPRIMKDLGRGN